MHTTVTGTTTTKGEAAATAAMRPADRTRLRELTQTQRAGILSFTDHTIHLRFGAMKEVHYDPSSDDTYACVRDLQNTLMQCSTIHTAVCRAFPPSRTFPSQCNLVWHQLHTLFRARYVRAIQLELARAYEWDMHHLWWLISGMRKLNKLRLQCRDQVDVLSQSITWTLALVRGVVQLPSSLQHLSIACSEAEMNTVAGRANKGRLETHADSWLTPEVRKAWRKRRLHTLHWRGNGLPERVLVWLCGGVKRLHTLDVQLTDMTDVFLWKHLLQTVPATCVKLRQVSILDGWLWKAILSNHIIQQAHILTKTTLHIRERLLAVLAANICPPHPTWDTCSLREIHIGTMGKAPTEATSYLSADHYRRNTNWKAVQPSTPVQIHSRSIVHTLFCHEQRRILFAVQTFMICAYASLDQHPYQDSIADMCSGFVLCLSNLLDYDVSVLRRLCHRFVHT